MAEETTTEAPAPAAPGLQEAAAPTEQMVSLAALREAHQERDAALQEVAGLQAAVQSLTGERDQAVTGLRRASVRMATGIDDDEIADMAHRRWASAMDGVEPDARLDVLVDERDVQRHLAEGVDGPRHNLHEADIS